MKMQWIHLESRILLVTQLLFFTKKKLLIFSDLFCQTVFLIKGSFLYNKYLHLRLRPVPS